MLAVGDSLTAGLKPARGEVWTAVLERELRERGHPSADVVNLGIDGTGTEVHPDLLRAFIPEFRPELVILAFYANDIDDALHGRFSRECYHDPARIPYPPEKIVVGRRSAARRSSSGVEEREERSGRPQHGRREGCAPGQVL